MVVVVLGVQAQPARRRAADVLGQRLGVGRLGADDARPLAGGALDRVVGRGDRDRQAGPVADVPAPVRQRRQALDVVAVPQVVERQVDRARPSRPSARRASARRGCCGSGSGAPGPRRGCRRRSSFFRFIAMNCGNCSIVGQAPTRNLRIADARQLGVAHQREQLVVDDARLVALGAGDDALQPERIAPKLLELTGAPKCVRHPCSPHGRRCGPILSRRNVLVRDTRRVARQTSAAVPSSTSSSSRKLIGLVR